MEIKLYDYWDEWGWSYCGIGMGNNSAEFVCALIDQAIAAKEDIKVRINSGGGLVYDGWAIYNALIAAKKSVTVIIQVDALAASIASIIAMAATDKPLFAKASLFMTHKPSIDPFWYGSMNADDLKKEAAVLDKIQAVLNSIYVEKTGLAVDVIDEMMNSETWLTPAECEALGFGTVMTETVEKAPISKEAMNSLFKGAPTSIRAYANTIFNIKENKMSKESSTLMKEVKNLLTSLAGHFNTVKKPEPKNSSSTLDDGSSIYYEGELKVDTEVFSDEAMTIPAEDAEYVLEDGTNVTTVGGKVTEIETPAAEETEPDNAAEIQTLKDEVETLKTENAALVQSLNESKTALEAINKIKSNYVPKDRTQNFIKPKDKADENEGQSIKERKAELEAKKKK